MRIVSRGILAGVAALLVAGSLGAQAATPRFSAHIVGNSARGIVAKHHFVIGDGGYNGLFRDRRHARTRYRVCWHHRGARVGCKSARTGRAAAYDRLFLLEPEVVGRFDYRWSVGGRVVAHWRITIGMGD